MRETKIYYYDYQESFLEMLYRNLENILTIVVVSFAFVTMLVAIHGNTKIERQELQLNIERSLRTLKQVEVKIPEIPKEDTAIPEEKIAEKEKEEIEEVQMTVESTIQIAPTANNFNYNPTEEDRLQAYKVAFAEALGEGEMGQILVINVAINNMRKEGYSCLSEEFFKSGRYSSVRNGEVIFSGKVIQDEDIPETVKDAVDKAFAYDYSEQMLKEIAEQMGFTDETYWKGGATYFYNPDACSEYQNSLRQNIKVKFKYGNHVFYRYWNK